MKAYWPLLQEKLKDELKQEPNLEKKIDLLRTFPREQRRDIEARDLAGELPPLELFEELTSLAEAVLRGSYFLVNAELRKTHPPPQGSFSIIAMGKLGGHELTYRSDLDLIYLYEENTDQEYYTRLGTRVISALSLLTREGYAYKIDTALRPSGNAGTLVSTLLSFQEYHQEVGRIWEKQALIKARPLQGLTLESVPFEKTIERTFDHIVYQPYDPQKVAQEINHLRNRMEKELAQEKPGRYQIKTGRGGIVDIEFATQFLQLIHGYHHKNLKLTSTVLALRSLAQEKILVPSLAQFLEEAYLFYRILETRLRLILDQPTDNLIEGTEWIKKLEDRFFGGKPLIKRYLEIREEVRSIYKKMLNL